ncbi:MAG TPA: sialidase family protein [Victivallales bacterium]|nr:sialidase family protein [Victivallales bacterium]
MEKESVKNHGPVLLAQDYSVVAKVPEDTNDFYSFFPSNAFAGLGDGKFLVASSVIQRPSPGTSVVLVLRSLDNGLTWNETARLNFKSEVEVALFAKDGRVFMLIVSEGRDGILMVAASSDDGVTWETPVEVIHQTSAKFANIPFEEKKWVKEKDDKDDFWFCAHQTAMLEHEGRLYFSLSRRCQTVCVAVCELASDILSPKSWRISQQAEMPIPKELTRNLFPGRSMRCLEGNVIKVKGSLRVMARAVIDRYGTSNMAAIFDISDDGGEPKLTFGQFYPLPGGQCKFFIIYDEKSRLYWMASNPPADSQGACDLPERKTPPGNDRRFMMLWYACDALNWFPAGCIAMTENLNEAFMYPSIVIDGDDLAILSRTSKLYEGLRSAERAKKGFHDANLLTFHRVRNFRALALNIFPKMWR